VRFLESFLNASREISSVSECILIDSVFVIGLLQVVEKGILPVSKQEEIKV